jgi:hypothetical protein
VLVAAASGQPWLMRSAAASRSPRLASCPGDGAGSPAHTGQLQHVERTVEQSRHSVIAQHGLLTLLRRQVVKVLLLEVTQRQGISTQLRLYTKGHVPASWV